jgi:hypothetical protein
MDSYTRMVRDQEAAELYRKCLFRFDEEYDCDRISPKEKMRQERKRLRRVHHMGRKKYGHYLWGRKEQTDDPDNHQPARKDINND